MTRTSAPEEQGLEHLLRAARPTEGNAAALQKRLAVASILSAAGSERPRPRLGKLEVQSRIGGGAMGIVYRAFDLQLQRPVAVKLLRGLGEGDAHRTILEEARQLARLSHPNVVAVHDIVDEGDNLYFTMEYVAGVTLAAWLQAHPDGSFRDVLEWFVQAGRGLAAAHAAGLVHRDFKPDNVLVGNDGRVRVVDFGLALAWQEASAGEVAGTPHFMAPEVRDGAAATPLSDQYSYCRALRDALGERALPAHVATAIARGLSDDPATRHRDLSVLLEVLQGALAGAGDERPRALLLERVERLWLHGVLERALGAGTAAELRLRPMPSLVDPPWRDWKHHAEQAGAAPDTGNTPGTTPLTSSRSLVRQLGVHHDSLLLVGPPGAGKTTLLLQLCRELWRTASLNPEAPAPAVLSLSTYRPPSGHDDARHAAHFGAWVVDELVTKYGLPRPAVGRWLAASDIVLLLDGLDEADAATRGPLVETLNRFRRTHPLPMVVTCRDDEYAALDARLSFGGALAVQPLQDDAMTALLEERHAVRLLEQLGRDPELREQLRNPLLLTLYASGGNGDGDGDGEEPAADGPHPNPASWTRAHARYVAGVWTTIDTAERATLQSRLTWLARAMQRTNTSDLWLERLHFGWLDSRWAQRTGYATGVLLVCLFGVGLNLLQVALTGSPLGSALVFGFGVSLSSFAYTRGRITPIESLSWSGRRAVRLLPVTMACALVIGLIEAMKINFVSNLAGAGITGAIMAVLLSLEPGERATKVRTNAGIHQSLYNALLVSVASSLPVGLFFYGVVQPLVTHPLAEVPEYHGEPALIVGVTVGLFVFTAMFLIYGGFSVLMHYVLRLWLAFRTPLPLDLEVTLNRAAELGLMRRVGGGYVFMHRTLLDYFAFGQQLATEPAAVPVDQPQPPQP